MVTKEEFIEALGTIYQFCNEQENCVKCPIIGECCSALNLMPLQDMATNFIEEMRLKE